MFEKYKKPLLWLSLTPLYFWFSHYFAVFPHEFAHSLVASLAGFKDHFWQIDYGGTSPLNIAFLVHIDEDVDYGAMYAAHKDWLVGLTAFAGLGIGNGLTYWISSRGMSERSVQSRPWLFYFFFWWNVNSIGNFIDYVPSRTFGTHGDMANLANGLHVSPWWIMCALGYPTIAAFWRFYANTLPCTSRLMGLKRGGAYSLLLLLVTYLLFGLYGHTGAKGYGDISHFVSMLSQWLILPVLVFCGPQREWVKMKLSAQTAPR